MSENTSDSWSWAVRYVIVIALLAILAAGLGSMELFHRTTLDGGRLSASNIVQFLGYGAALVLAWLMAREATIHLQKQGGSGQTLQHLILPVVSLVVVALAYTVLLLLLKPFMGTTFRSIYDWLFIAAILACAGWLVAAVLNKADQVTAFLTQKK